MTAQTAAEESIVRVFQCEYAPTITTMPTSRRMKMGSLRWRGGKRILYLCIVPKPYGIVSASQRVWS